MDKINLAEKLGKFHDHFKPRIIGELNGQHVKLVKFAAPFVWHHHEHEDEMFLVVKGSLLMKLRDGDLTINPGEFVIIPKGVEHNPCAAEECHVLLFEPATTLNTGNIRNEKTVENPDRI